MSTDTKNIIREGYEPIPGYRLEHQLGSGGFGEVWRCQAPGGLHKAIKFVFGSLDDKRAKRELKSLERIKGVHHPFLLTLERFEVVDGRLMIITELADGSLEDVYNRHRDRGAAGIPRKALLSYLQDAADALDYLNTSFQLQHLDVKPGNLLMVGGHVKVADFGLLKDLRDVECSVVGGLTPIYAPPEVFDGRPCSTSDQYSLAVMYQELLTGTRPFAGRTIAQLATQHVHSAPNLESLPPADRPVLAKALEKAPERRFESCLAFVESLRGAGGQVVRNRRDSFCGGAGGETQTGTFLGQSPMLASKVEDLPKLTSEVGSLVPVGVAEHALIIGLGGIGAECLHRLRGRIASLHPMPPIDLHSVLIDTDAETIEGARLAEASGRVTPCTAIYTPLRSPKQYRDIGTSHLGSVSRRWLYNVPRSAMTEGVRPLGRLAMVDHADSIKRHLSESIDHLAAVCGNSIPRIYVVASLAGGTGSGMVWDISYLMRYLLDSQGLADAELRPILLMPDMTNVSRHPLATADAHAALAELLHYLQPGNSYPGDEGANWPSVPAARSPLSNTYLVAGPDSSGAMCSSVEMVTEYIWMDATKGGNVLEAARRDPGEEEIGIVTRNATVRSLGAVRFNNGVGIEVPRLANTLSIAILKSWLGRPVEAKQLAGNMAEKLARRIGLDSRGLQESVWAPLPSEEGKLWQRLYDILTALPMSNYTPEECERVLAEMGILIEESDDSIKVYCDTVLQNLRHEISLRLQDGRCDLTTACESVSLLSESIASVQELHQLAGPRRIVEAEAAAAAMKAGLNRLHPSEILGNSREPGPVMRWAELYLRSAADTRLTQRSGMLLAGVKRLLEELRCCVTNVAVAVKVISSANESTDDPWKSLAAEVRSERGRAEEAVRQLAAPKVLSFSQAGHQMQTTGSIISSTVIDTAVPIVESLVGTQDCEEASAGQNVTVFESVADALRAVRPMLLVCGGRQRLVLLVGSDSEKDKLAAEVAENHGQAISVVVIPGISPTLIHEAQGVPLTDILNRLQISLGGDSRVLGRLHARSDIRWNAC